MALPRRRVVVIACGQHERGDDAVALHAAVSLGDWLAPDDRVADGQPPNDRAPDVRLSGGLEVEDILAIRADEALIVVDAVDGPAAGEIVVRPLESLLPLAVADASTARRIGGLAPRSTHSMPIPDVLALAVILRPDGRLPAGSFVGIGIASVAFGRGLSPAVAAALPTLVDAIAAEVTRLGGDGG